MRASLFKSCFCAIRFDLLDVFGLAGTVSFNLWAKFFHNEADKKNWKAIFFFCLVYVWLPGCHDHATDFSRGGVSRIYAWLCCFFWTLIEISLTSLKALGKAHHFFSLLLSTPSSSRYFYIFCLNRCNQASNGSKWHTNDILGVKIYEWKYLVEPEKVALLKIFPSFTIFWRSLIRLKELK